MLRQKFVALNEYIWKEEKSQVLLQEQEKEQNQPKSSRRKEIIKEITEIIEVESIKATEKINESKNLVIRKIKKIEKPLARMTKITNIKTETKYITSYSEGIKQVIWEW